MKPSEWLEEHVESHTIYDHEKLAESWRENVDGAHSVPAPWPGITAETTRQAIEARGLGGVLRTTTPKHLVAWGYLVSAHICLYFKLESSQALGRGTSHRENIEILKSAGL